MYIGDEEDEWRQQGVTFSQSLLGETAGNQSPIASDTTMSGCSRPSLLDWYCTSESEHSGVEDSSPQCPDIPHDSAQALAFAAEGVDGAVAPPGLDGSSMESAEHVEAHNVFSACDWADFPVGVDMLHAAAPPPPQLGGDTNLTDPAAPHPAKRDVAKKCRICGVRMGYFAGLRGLGFRERGHQARCRVRMLTRWIDECDGLAPPASIV